MKNGLKGLWAVYACIAVLLLGVSAVSAADLPYWSDFDFGPNLEYAEEYAYEADSGEYLNPAEAAKLTFDAMRDKGKILDYSDATKYTMTLVDLMDVEGEECYVYSLDWGSETAGAAFAYAYMSGAIYMEGQMGIWVRPE